MPILEEEYVKRLATGCVAGALLLCGTAAQAQQKVILSWISKKALGAPISVNGPTQVEIVVTGVNDILYSYEGSITATPVQLSNIGGGGAGFQERIACPAQNLVNLIQKNWESWQVNPLVDERKQVTAGGPPNSVSVQTTEAFYKQNVEALYKKAAAKPRIGACTGWQELTQRYRDWEERLKSRHTYTIDATLEPLNNYTIHIREYYADENSQQRLTNACMQNGTASECTIDYEPKNDILTASGGYLISELQARSYNRANVPGSTDAVLQVGGTGRVSSVLAALINVKLPCFWGTSWGRFVPPCSPDGNEWGWALSVGPALQLGGSGQATKAGLFGGISLHLWKYVYVTPGIHVGDFADFPGGFTKPGQDIPSSFTSPLTAETRTSARF